MFRLAASLVLIAASAALAEPLTIVTATVPNLVVNQPYSFQFQATGGVPPYTWNGPAGSDYRMTPGGTLQGTATLASVYPQMPVSVVDSTGAVATRKYDITIAGPIQVLDRGAVITLGMGWDRTYVLAITSLQALTIKSGALPPGTRIQTAQYTQSKWITPSITGEPLIPGSYSVTFAAVGILGDTAEITYAIKVEGYALHIDLLPAYALPAGQPAFISWYVSGGASPYQYTITGQIPEGMSITPQMTAISGAPTRPGAYTLRVAATDRAGIKVEAATVITVGSPLALSASTLPLARNSNTYTAGLAATGGSPPYTWRLDNALPAGLSLSALGAISGLVTAPPGNYPFHVTVSDSARNSSGGSFTIVVAGPIVDARTLPNARADGAYREVLTATGGAPPYTWSIAAGRLPAGLSLDAATGAIQGVPAAAGQYLFSAAVVDVYKSTNSLSFTLNVDAAPLTFAAPVLSAGNVASPYTAMLTAAGGAPPYHFALDSGTLPDGLVLSSAGALTGTPARKGSYSLSVKVTDADRQAATAAVTLQILGAIPQLTAASLLNAASFREGLAPGEYISIFGAYLSETAEAAQALPLATVAARTSVAWNGAPLPLLAVSPGQINAQLPFDARPGKGELVVISDSVKSAPVSVTLQPAAPGLFQASDSVLLAINEDGTVNAPDNPARPGTIVMFYATGCGAYDAAVRAGDATPVDRLYRLASPAVVTVGDATAEVLFAGAAPGLGSGLVQFNVRIPTGAAGPSPVQLIIAGAASNAPKLYVTDASR